MLAKSPPVKDLGELHGPVLVFGGVYGNLQALEALKAVATAAGVAPQNTICTGDIAGYCAQPAECFTLIQQWGIHAIAGNVELQLLEGSDNCGCAFGEGSRCDIFSRQWFPYVQSQTTEAILTQIATLPQMLYFSLAGRRAAVVHGSAEETAAFVFASTPWEIKARSLALTGADWIISGHSGLPFVQLQNGRCWLNAGAIGMPANDGCTDVWYCIATPTEAGIQIQMYPLEYDCRQAAERMKGARLPLQYAATLESGLWDNCDILPDTETAQGGLPITPELLRAVF